MTGVVKGQGVAGAARVHRREVVLNGVKVATGDVVLGRSHDACRHHEQVDMSKSGVVGLDPRSTWGPIYTIRTFKPINNCGRSGMLRAHHNSMPSYYSYSRNSSNNACSL